MLLVLYNTRYWQISPVYALVLYSLSQIVACVAAHTTNQSNISFSHKFTHFFLHLQCLNRLYSLLSLYTVVLLLSSKDDDAETDQSDEAFLDSTEPPGSVTKRKRAGSKSLDQSRMSMWSLKPGSLAALSQFQPEDARLLTELYVVSRLCLVQSNFCQLLPISSFSLLTYLGRSVIW